MRKLRAGISPAEYQPVTRKEQQDPVCVTYERRNHDLDPQLVWRGKDEQDWSDLMVQATPLYIQEKVHLKVQLPVVYDEPRREGLECVETAGDT